MKNRTSAAIVAAIISIGALGFSQNAGATDVANGLPKAPQAVDTAANPRSSASSAAQVAALSPGGAVAHRRVPVIDPDPAYPLRNPLTGESAYWFNDANGK